MPALLAIIFFVLASISLRDALRAEEITATPNRPGVADPADVTQKGVVELEYGWERAFRSSEFRTRSTASGLLRFGLTEDFELRLGIDNYVTQRSDDPEGRRSGVGDTTPGFKYRLTKGDGIWPTLAFSYEVKMPTASRKKGLGSGRADHNLFFLASKDILGLEWDFNYQLGWIGK